MGYKAQYNTMTCRPSVCLSVRPSVCNVGGDQDHIGSDVNKDLGLKAKAKAKDSRYQGQIFHRSSQYIIFSSLTLCECFYVRILHFVTLWINGYVIALNDIDKEECQTVNTPKRWHRCIAWSIWPRPTESSPRPRPRPRTSITAHSHRLELLKPTVIIIAQTISVTHSLFFRCD